MLRDRPQIIDGAHAELLAEDALAFVREAGEGAGAVEEVRFEARGGEEAEVAGVEGAWEGEEGGVGEGGEEQGGGEGGECVCEGEGEEGGGGELGGRGLGGHFGGVVVAVVGCELVSWCCC